jgi:hypothetical protein
MRPNRQKFTGCSETGRRAGTDQFTLTLNFLSASEQAETAALAAKAAAPPTTAGAVDSLGLGFRGGKPRTL